jgi:hypothetical protein
VKKRTVSIRRRLPSSPRSTVSSPFSVSSRDIRPFALQRDVQHMSRVAKGEGCHHVGTSLEVSLRRCFLGDLLQDGSDNLRVLRRG